MAAELFMDGYVSLLRAQSETRKLQKDRYLRSALILLYASLEAELNRQLNVVSHLNPLKIDEKLRQVLTSKQVGLTEQGSLLKEMDFTNTNSFRAVRNGIAHFKGDYRLYGITEKNIDQYFKFTKTVFEIIHSSSTITEWINKAHLSMREQ